MSVHFLDERRAEPTRFFNGPIYQPDDPGLKPIEPPDCPPINPPPDDLDAATGIAFAALFGLAVSVIIVLFAILIWQVTR